MVFISSDFLSEVQLLVLLLLYWKSFFNSLKQAKNKNFSSLVWWTFFSYRYELIRQTNQVTSAVLRYAGSSENTINDFKCDDSCVERSA